MRYIFSLVVTFISLSGITQPLYFSFPFSLSGSGNMHPRVSLVNGEEPLLVWGDPSNGDNLFYANWNGGGFNTPNQLTYNGETVMLGYAEGPVMLAKNNTVFITYVSMGASEHRVYLRKSTDGGQTFSDTVLVNDRSNGLSLEYATMTLDDSGNPIVVFIRNEIGDVPKQVVYRSVDGGNTFLSEINGTPDALTQPCECCPAAIATAGNNIYISYRNNDSNIRDFYVSASRDAGLSFDTLVRIDNTNWFSSACPASGASSTLSGDTLYSVYASKINGRFSVKATSLHQNDLSLGVERLVDTTFLSENFTMNYPEISGSGDTIGIVWQDNRSGQYRIWFSYSPNGLQNLSAPVMISDFISGIQQNPHLIFKNGTFHITWRDYTNSLIWYRKVSFNPDVLALNDLSENAIQVFPNPASAYLSISNPEKKALSLSLLDITGQLVFTDQINSDIKINTEQFRPGVYLIQLSDGNSVVSKKLIIQR